MIFEQHGLFSFQNNHVSEGIARVQHHISKYVSNSSAIIGAKRGILLLMKSIFHHLCPQSTLRKDYL